MAATIHHPNVTVLTYAGVDRIRRDADGRFHVTVRRKPRFVDEAACTGCQQCELACTVAVPDQFNADLVGRRAAYIPFPQAVPKKAVIERAGTSPCTYTCPAGIKAHGYVSLVRGGQYEKAFQLILEATPLVGSLGRVELADEPPRAGHEPLVRHSWEPLLPRQQRQLAEETLACWLRFGHWISGLEQAPVEVRFRHPAPADTTEHRRIFRCPVLFGQADNALVFPRRLLALPLGQADSQIQRTLDAYAGRLLESIRRGEGVLERARQCLAERLPEQAVDLEALAGELALSPRTLQRRLRDSGLSFSRLVDETRQQLVLHHLRDPALELADVASLVGFSETGSLARAFRRWTGQSLGQYRRTLQPLADS